MNLKSLTKFFTTFALAALIFLPFTFAYIDPGSGGYLISALWGWVISIFAVAFAFVAHFFRHTMALKARMIWKKHKKILVVLSLLVVISLIAFLIVSFRPQSQRLSSYDLLEGVQVYNESAAYDGYTLVNGTLFNMGGTIVHQWNNTGYLGIIDRNGDFYAQSCYECPKWGRYSWNGSVIWEKNFAIHHEILLTKNNTLMVLTKEVHEYNGRNVEFDVVVELTKDGVELNRWSIWDNLAYLQQFHQKLQLDQPSNFLLPENMWKNTSTWGGNYDYYHMNSLSLVPQNARGGVHPAFKEGNWIFSFRHGSMVFVLDKDTKQIQWRAIDNQIKDGRLEGPHAAQMLDNGDILVMDNGRYREWSRIIEIDPVTLEVVWEYKSPDFFTLSQGYVQLLPNGNYLITESEDGRVFEITKNKEIVWEWFTSERWGFGDEVKPEFKGKRHDLYRAIRYPKDMIDEFITRLE